MNFHTPHTWIERRVRVLLLGAGGTGGEVLYALARTHKVLLALGHPGGLHVTLVDGDQVSSANIGRQRFAECDIGHYKADVLIQRFNLFFMLDWRAVSAFWSPSQDTAPSFREVDLLISCVDRAGVRVALACAGAQCSPPLLWMDFGNGQHTGQCVLGHLGRDSNDGEVRLPTVYDLFPELQSVDDNETPSCSAAEAIRQQDLFVNPLLAEAGISLLWKLLRHGSTDTHGVFIDTREPSVDPLWIDPPAWAFYGYSRPTTQSTTARPRSTRRRTRQAAIRPPQRAAAHE